MPAGPTAKMAVLLTTLPGAARSGRIGRRISDTKSAQLVSSLGFWRRPGSSRHHANAVTQSRAIEYQDRGSDIPSGYTGPEQIASAHQGQPLAKYHQRCGHHVEVPASWQIPNRTQRRLSFSPARQSCAAPRSNRDQARTISRSHLAIARVPRL